MLGRRKRKARVVTSIALYLNQEQPVPQPPQVPFWKQPAIYVSAAFVPLIYVTVILVLQGNFSTEVKVMVIAAVLGALTAITGFWLATSYSSGKKDDVIAGTTSPTTINTPGPATTTINQGTPT